MIHPSKRYYNIIRKKDRYNRSLQFPHSPGLSRAAALDFYSGFGGMHGETDENHLVFVLCRFCRPETLLRFRQKVFIRKSPKQDFFDKQKDR